MMSQPQQAEADSSVSKLKGRQTSALGQATKKRNAIVPLLVDDDNLPTVKDIFEEYKNLFQGYQKAHQTLLETLSENDETERTNEIHRHSQHENEMIQFTQNIKDWIYKVENRFSDQVDVHSRKSGSTRSSVRSSTSSTTRARLVEQARQAALVIQRESMKKEEELERRRRATEEEYERKRNEQRNLERAQEEEYERKRHEQRNLELAREEERRKQQRLLEIEQAKQEGDIRMQQRKLEIDTEIEMSKAKERVFAGTSETKDDNTIISVSTAADGMNTYLESQLNQSNPFISVGDTLDTFVSLPKPDLANVNRFSLPSNVTLPDVSYLWNQIPVTSSVVVSNVLVNPPLYDPTPVQSFLKVSATTSYVPGQSSAALSIPNRYTQGNSQVHTLQPLAVSQPYSYGTSRPPTVSTYASRTQPQMYGNGHPPGLNQYAQAFIPSSTDGNAQQMNGNVNRQPYTQHAPAAAYDPQPLPDDATQQGNVSVHSMVSPSNDTSSPRQLQLPYNQAYLDPMQQLVATMTLPQPEVPKFGGDPMEYNTFMMAFKSRIESRVSNSSDRLYYLDQHLVGEAKSIIEGCLHMNPDQGYDEAQSTLQLEYGDPYKIATSYIDKVLGWPIVKHDADLKVFSIFLKKCNKAMVNIASMEVLNHIPNLQAILAKLPSYLQNRWRDSANTMRTERERLPTFSDLTKFVSTASNSANDPLFGKNAINKFSQPTPNGGRAPQKSKPFQRGKAPQPGKTTLTSSFALTNANSDNQKSKIICAFCEKHHDIDNCREFLKKTVDDRRAWVKEKRLCFGCFGEEHTSRGCLKKRKCETCSRKHPTSLHDSNFQYREANDTYTPQQQANTVNSSLVQASVINVNALQGDVPRILHAILPVKVTQRGNGKPIETYAFYDNGSSGCFLTDDLRKQLQAKGDETTLTITTMHGTSNINCTAVSDLVVTSMKGENPIELPRAFTREEIPVDHSHIPRSDLLDQWSHLKEATSQMHPYLPNVSIGLLIGSNCAKALQPSKVIPTSGDGPFAALYPHGWVINGPLQITYEASNMSVVCNRINVKENFRENILSLFEQDFSDGYSSPDKLGHSSEDLAFLAGAEANLQLVDRHFVLPLPFRVPGIEMPNNRVQAVKRAGWQKKKMIKNDQYREDYKRFVHDLLEKGYAREIEPDEIATEPGGCWYLPHHGVYHPVKLKIRVVFDCSARYDNVALNDCLLQGPDLTSSLIGVLARFRQEPVAFIGDIEAMFHQIKVTGPHQNFLRFLWWPNGDLQAELKEYCMTVHLFGATSSPSVSNFALKKTADLAEVTYGPDVADTIRKNFYVDDCLRSMESEAVAVKMINDLRKACQLGGFRLTKFCSNRREVLNAIPPQERSKELQTQNLDYEQLPSERALGVYWNVDKDQLGFVIKLKEKPYTRRGILSVTSSVYDPLGLVSPFVLNAKKILQDLCRNETLDWDDPLPDEHVTPWSDWLRDLPLLEKVCVNRCIKPLDFGAIITTELHVFSDASTFGYGAVAYLRIIDVNGNIHCAFLMGKSRLAPLKKTTLPRLELTAATVALRVGCLLRDELDIRFDRICYHTDSTTVLHFILNRKKRFPVFVTNRVQFIHEHSDASQWRYINTKENPADHASRGMTVQQITTNAEWFNGPEFLWKPEVTWPQQPTLSKDYSLEDTPITSAMVQVNPSVNSVDILITHYSEWYRLKRAVAIYRKFFEFLQQRSNDTRSQTTDCHITVNDIWNAENALVKYVQAQAFPSELDCLRERGGENKKKLLKSSPLYKLDPVLDRCVLRVGGRLSRANIPENSKYPVLLPNTGHVTDLIIRHIHVKLAHAGRNHVLGHLREAYWVIHANSAVRRVLSKCITCKRQQAPVMQQKMSDLPAERTSVEPPFTYTGVDFFGPFRIKQGRKEIKYYGALFTCLSSRAVHIEVAASLETDSFINVLRRFIARRGKICQLRCDNGTNFVGAERELREALAEMNEGQVKQALTRDSIQWVFNPPAASHMGGIWERQIRTVRKVLASLSREFGTMLDLESFQTLMCEIEAIINSRPLTTASPDPNDLNVLTPNHILTMKSNVILPPPGRFQRDDMYLRKRWKRVQHVANVFWTRWKQEYLLGLQERQKWCEPSKSLKSGDIVLMKDDSQPRNKWPLARVIETEPDKKGIVRSVRVKTASSEYRRPIDRLVLLIPVDQQ